MRTALMADTLVHCASSPAPPFAPPSDVDVLTNKLIAREEDLRIMQLAVLGVVLVVVPRHTQHLGRLQN